MEKGTENNKYRKWILCGGRALFFLYMACLVYFLFFSERYGRTVINQEYRYNLRLFQEIRRFWAHRDVLGPEIVFVNLAGNVGVFVPVGFAVPLLFGRFHKFYQVALLSFEISLLAEVIQLVAKVGTFDVDDLLLNTIGGCIGYACYYLCGRKWRKGT